MNLPTLLVLLLVAAALFLALRAYLHGRGRCSCGSSGDAPAGCSGKRSSACTGCPYCQGK
jgi:hypothetical protein